SSDLSVFGNNAPATAIYSQLVQGNTGIDMAIQSLAYTDLGSDIAVPLGINASTGQSVTISIATTTLPAGIEVFLEDTSNNSFTLLNTGDFTFTATTALNDTGRFYLRFADTTLSNPEEALDQLHIYATTAPKTLYIKGQLNEETTVDLYDIQGRLVLSSILDSTNNSN